MTSKSDDANEEAEARRLFSEKMALVKSGSSSGRCKMIDDWRNDPSGAWYCYWDDSYGMPKDLQANYVFCPPLERSVCGVIRPKEWDVSSTNRNHFYYPYLEQLLEIQSTHKDIYVGWGDESDGTWEPILIPWDASSLTPQTVLERLGAHPQLIQSIDANCSLIRKDDDDDDDDEQQQQQQQNPGIVDIQRFLDRHQQSVAFFAGSERLNPVPCFAVAQVRDDLVAGFIGSVVHT